MAAGQDKDREAEGAGRVVPLSPTSAEGAAAPGSTEPLTEELLARLMAAASPEAYLAQADLPDRTLSDYLFHLLDQAGMSRADVARATGMQANYLYQIFQGTKRPSRDYVLRIALALGCDLRQAQRLLRLAGVGSLWPKDRRDAVVIYCIEHHLGCQATDEELWHLGEATLAPQEG